MCLRLLLFEFKIFETLILRAEVSLSAPLAFNSLHGDRFNRVVARFSRVVQDNTTQHKRG